MTEPQLLHIDGWTFQWQPAQKPGGRLAVLIHGLTGDENSMWVFGKYLKGYSLLSPRGPNDAKEIGYTWRRVDSRKDGSFPSSDDLHPAAVGLLNFLDHWMRSIGQGDETFDLIGFSQGAAMTYLLTFIQPERIGKLAALSGFLPDRASELLGGRSLAGKKVFIAHNRQDEMVPVEQARIAQEFFRKNAAEVTYCENDGGHKVSRDCMASFEQFFKLT